MLRPLSLSQTGWTRTNKEDGSTGGGKLGKERARLEGTGSSVPGRSCFSRAAAAALITAT